eukprot:TRINITY_DN23276_c0_g1_i1.p1 TRINITY_DN23276_c0_g1~~TRINITY_DN23276_c0_g1_i1.p1  ORF type:complete len:247 (-),score=27.00 TRINITY_DN23276_c0_g1_i1:552-1292(-)
MEGNREEHGEDEKMCRICHGGEDDGKLISPCKCKGSIKYVHIECLDRWRQTSSNSQSYFQCENCHYKYNFSRPSYAQLMKSKIVLHVVTLLLLVFAVIICGYLWKLVEFLISEEETSWKDFFWIDLSHLMSGSVMVGILGSFQIFMLSGLRLSAFGFGRGGSGRGDSLVLMIIVAFGMLRVFKKLYGLVQTQTERALARVENMIPKELEHSFLRRVHYVSSDNESVSPLSLFDTEASFATSFCSRL